MEGFRLVVEGNFFPADHKVIIIPTVFDSAVLREGWVLPGTPGMSKNTKSARRGA